MKVKLHSYFRGLWPMGKKHPQKITQDFRGEPGRGGQKGHSPHNVSDPTLPPPHPTPSFSGFWYLYKQPLPPDFPRRAHLEG